jgi:hypothetical protein
MPWLRHFALFVVFVAALFRPVAAGAFSSAPDANAQARVGAFELVAATLVGPASAATCGTHEGIGAAYDENASGYRFAAKGATTEPTLPPKTIASEGEVTVEHYYRSGDHSPAHAHVTGGGATTRIGPNGKPLAGQPELTGPQQAAVDAKKSTIRSGVNKIGRWLKFQENK